MGITLATTRMAPKSIDIGSNLLLSTPPTSPSIASGTSSIDETELGTYHFRGARGIERFWQIVSGDGERAADGTLNLSTAREHVRQMQVLHIDLNEEWHEDYIDDILTDALASFAVLSGQGDTLQKLHLHVGGSFLFTKHTYILPQPAAAAVYSTEQERFSETSHKTLPLHRLQYGRHPLTVKEKLDLFHAGKLRPTITPKAFVNALLKLRNIREVEIHGPMEASLQQEIILTIGRGRRVDFEPVEKEGLTAGDVWHMQRVPRDGWVRQDSETASHHRDADHGGWIFSTQGKYRIVLGWPLEGASQ